MTSSVTVEGRSGASRATRSSAGLLGAAAIGIAAFLTCRAAQPERAVVDDTVISSRDPAVEIKLPRSVHYVGSDRFLLTDPQLGDFDDCELYAFVDSDGNRRVRKFYWVQFEGYLPNQPTLHYTYDSPRHTTIGGLDFYVDTGVSSPLKPPKAGSDGAHFYSLLASQGYQRDDMMSVRLVHLIDSTKRRELMIIYAESLAPTGYTAVQLQEGGAEHAKWTAMADGLTRRAVQSLTITSVARSAGRKHDGSRMSRALVSTDVALKFTYSAGGVRAQESN